MAQVIVTPVTQDSIHDLDFALKALSTEMGDHHVATTDTLSEAFLGVHSDFKALIAYSSNQVIGAIAWSPMFSTTRGGGGLFVSDLWVAASARGQGVGRKLLAGAVADSDKSSGAHFLKLAVHRTNEPAYSYYVHLGFENETDMSTLILEGAPLQGFKNT